MAAWFLLKKGSTDKYALEDIPEPAGPRCAEG